ncbi:MAG: hypothetical protein A2342_04780 [Gallionellales bacterium RIFOXYB12_FULL_54_9]|nr:MAG: hypothetical protein A2342_04780 [Gallionellales bacterium RIFOXYB12_FULL_54_9]
MLIIIIAAVVLLAGGGAAAYFMMKPAHPDKHAAKVEDAGDDEEEDDTHPKVPPKFVELGTYTANLVQEDADRMLQVEISIKLSKPELEEKVKERQPEIKHRINMLLQSKRASELSSVEGKEVLAQQIKEHVEFVMGLRKVAPAIQTSHPGEEGKAEKISESSHSRKGVAEVLFTSFIIQ